MRQVTDQYPELATRGRHGDRHLAHVATGEMIVPPVVSDATLFSIHQDMIDAGLDPERYTVGGKSMSINPETGQPEFFFKALKKVLKKIAPVALPIIGNSIAPGIGGVIGGGLGGAVSGGGLKGALTGAGGVVAGNLIGGALGNVMNGRPLSQNVSFWGNTGGAANRVGQARPAEVITWNGPRMINGVAQANSPLETILTGSRGAAVGANQPSIMDRILGRDTSGGAAGGGSSDASSILRDATALLQLGGAFVDEEDRAPEGTRTQADIQQEIAAAKQQEAQNNERFIQALNAAPLDRKAAPVRSYTNYGQTDVNGDGVINELDQYGEELFFDEVNPKLPVAQMAKGGMVEDIENDADMLDFLASVRNTLYKRGGKVNGVGGGQDDNVPAMLSPGEYVMTAEEVAAAGDGNSDAGARKLKQLGRNLVNKKRQASGRNPKKAPKQLKVGA
jgi:hypothetical protein